MKNVIKTDLDYMAATYPDFAIIIPDRNDRHELTEFCLKQIRRMTLQPTKIYHIKDRPQTEKPDLIHRVTVGVNLAKADGFEYVFLVENDDFYKADHFERYLAQWGNADFIGDEKTTYYSLRNLTFRTMEHKYRSSLFTTAFRISALNHFNFKALNPERVFLDIDLWEYARTKRRKFVDSGALGMKHGVGLCGGKGHGMTMPNKDIDLAYLRNHVDQSSFEFYYNLSQKLK